MEQLTRVDNGLVNAISAMQDGELMVLTKLLLEIEYFELVMHYLASSASRFKPDANLTSGIACVFCSWRR